MSELEREVRERRARASIGLVVLVLGVVLGLIGTLSALGSASWSAAPDRADAAASVSTSTTLLFGQRPGSSDEPATSSPAPDVAPTNDTAPPPDQPGTDATTPTSVPSQDETPTTPSSAPDSVPTTIPGADPPSETDGPGADDAPEPEEIEISISSERGASVPVDDMRAPGDTDTVVMRVDVDNSPGEWELWLEIDAVDPVATEFANLVDDPYGVRLTVRRCAVPWRTDTDGQRVCDDLVAAAGPVAPARFEPKLLGVTGSGDDRSEVLVELTWPDAAPSLQNHLQGHRAEVTVKVSLVGR